MIRRQPGTEPAADTPRRAAAASGACEAVNDFLGMQWECGQVPAVPYRRICVHEHVREGWLCAGHVELNQAACCRTCAELPGELAHDCPIALELVPGGAP